MQKTFILKLEILVLIGVLFFHVSFSQENYLPGTIINLKGDTLKGIIDYRNWEINPEYIHFKTETDNNPIIFTPLEIIEFSVKDEIYAAAVIESEISPSTTNILQEDHSLHIKIDTIFLQTIFQGTKSLYFYNDKRGNENFYIKQNEVFELLVHKKYRRKQEGETVIAENKKYIGQLIFYLNDCESIQSRINTTLYTQKSLDELFDKYYQCSQSEIDFQKKREKVSTDIGMLVGASISSLEFRSNDFSYLVDADYDHSTNFATAVFFDFILPRSQRKWSINNELLFTSYKITGLYENYENENIHSTSTTEIGYSFIKINNLVRFKYPIKNIFVYVNGGISNGFALRQTNYRREEATFYTTERNTEAKAVDDSRTYEQSFVFGLGAKYKEFSFETRYERGNGMSAYLDLQSISRRVYFLLGYRFKK